MPNYQTVLSHDEFHRAHSEEGGRVLIERGPPRVYLYGDGAMITYSSGLNPALRPAPTDELVRLEHAVLYWQTRLALAEKFFNFVKATACGFQNVAEQPWQPEIWGTLRAVSSPVERLLQMKKIVEADRAELKAVEDEYGKHPRVAARRASEARQRQFASERQVAELNQRLEIDGIRI